MHSCYKFNLASPPAQWVQDGWKDGRNVYGRPVRVPNMVQIQPTWKDLPCQYIGHETDPDCPDFCPRKHSPTADNGTTQEEVK